MFNIVRREEMAEGTVILNEIEAPNIAKKALPGQFVILKSGEDGERIPLTMAYTDKEKGTITIIYMLYRLASCKFKPFDAPRIIYLFILSSGLCWISIFNAICAFEPKAIRARAAADDVQYWEWVMIGGNHHLHDAIVYF